MSPRARSRDPPITTIAEDSVQVSWLDCVRMLGGGLLLAGLLSLLVTKDSFTWTYRPPWTRPARIHAWLQGPLVLTDAELAQYDGSSAQRPILLGLRGEIYDVSASPQTYGVGGAYHFFAGRDAARAFVTGCFDTDLTGDLRGVEDLFVEPDVRRTDKQETAQRKIQREQQRRWAHRRVNESIEGWRRLFDGGRNGAYFWRGTIHRGPGSGWPGWGPLKPLCERGHGRRQADQVGG